MVVKVASTCLHSIVPHSISSSQTKRRSRSGDGGAHLCLYVQNLNRSALFGTSLRRSQSYESQKPRNRSALRRGCSASLDAFSDEEFSKRIQELALRFQLSDDNSGTSSSVESETETETALDSRDNNGGGERHGFDIMSESASRARFLHSDAEFQLDLEPPWPSSDWPRIDNYEIVPEASIEMKANSVDLPLSLRIIKRKMQWEQDGYFRDVGESACSSVKKAFSSMVFIIRELHSYSLQMREALFLEDLQGILGRVQKEMHASFVWLFQQVFSQTPTLMVYVMILLANFTVYSLGHNAAIEAPPPSHGLQTETVEMADDGNKPQFDSSTSKSFSVSSSSSSGGKTISIGGINGGGGNVRPVGSGMEGDGGLDRSDNYRTIVPDGASQMSSLGKAESVSHSREDEAVLWDSMVEEAHQMEGKDESLDHETLQRFVSPLTADIESDDYEEYFKTEIQYQDGLSREPNNALLLSNYAQFLYQVAHDYDSAEVYFKRAVEVKPADAEAYNKYATFLWRVRNDLWAAEETYLEAINADPTNSYYAANYAHFLWNTGGEDTCFPLSSPDTQDA